MPDLYLDLGDDLILGPGGDLLLADNAPGDPTLTNQRLGRRYFTNPQETAADGSVIAPADYVFHPAYGGGLPRLIDGAVSDGGLRAIARRLEAQTAQESTVAPFPAPAASVTRNGNEVDCLTSYQPAAGAPAQVGFTYSP